jgi:uncharacterized protein (DUF1499 family)
MSKVFQIYLLFSICIILYSCIGGTPKTIGMFASCPEKPNCVSTKKSNSENFVNPIYYDDTFLNARQNLLLAINSFESADIKKELDQFIHVEFTSSIFRFVDDVEFYLNEPGVIHFRSASRVGYSDLGVNRRRMERIRLFFKKINNYKK